MFPGEAEALLKIAARHSRREEERGTAVRLAAGIVRDAPEMIPRVLSDVFGGDLDAMKLEIAEPAVVRIIERWERVRRSK